MLPLAAFGCLSAFPLATDQYESPSSPHLSHHDSDNPIAPLPLFAAALPLRCPLSPRDGCHFPHPPPTTGGSRRRRHEMVVPRCFLPPPPCLGQTRGGGGDGSGGGGGRRRGVLIMGSPTPPTASPPCPRALLVTPTWLAAALSSATPPSVVDTRGAVRKVATTPHPDGDGRMDVAVAYTAARGAYAAAAIPSATFLDWTVDVGAQGGRGLPRADAEALLASVGVTRRGMTGGVDVDGAMYDGESGVGGRGGRGGDEVRTVVYDDGAMLFATRLWWAASRLGIRGVAVLDGGWAAWTAAGLPTEPGRVGATSAATTLAAAAPCPPFRVTPTAADAAAADTAVAAAAAALPLLTADDVAAGLVDAAPPSSPTAGSSSTLRRVLIDARSAAQFSGRERRGARGGAIPGAVNLPYRSLLGPGGVGLAAPPDLRAAFEAAGVAPPPPEQGGARGEERVAVTDEGGGGGPPPPLPALGVYCNGGVASTVVIFCWVLLGGGGAANYGGSWNEWGARRDLPVVRGWV